MMKTEDDSILGLNKNIHVIIIIQVNGMLRHIYCV